MKQLTKRYSERPLMVAHDLAIAFMAFATGFMLAYGVR